MSKNLKKICHVNILTNILLEKEKGDPWSFLDNIFRKSEGLATNTHQKNLQLCIQQRRELVSTSTNDFGIFVYALIAKIISSTVFIKDLGNFSVTFREIVSSSI